MLVLEEVQPPTEDVVGIQSQVVAYWEHDCLGQGTLYLSVRTVVWISNTTRKGFRLTYPAITVHATSSSNETFPEPCLFLVIDVKKTDIEYAPEMDADMEKTDDDSVTATIRFVPADTSAIPQLYDKMNECQVQNPEMDDEMNQFDEEEEEEPLGDHIVADIDDEAIEGLGDGQWYTADSATDEIRLSAEGRANLERMIGTLNDANEEDLHQPPLSKSNGHTEMEHD